MDSALVTKSTGNISMKIDKMEPAKSFLHTTNNKHPFRTNNSIEIKATKTKRKRLIHMQNDLKLSLRFL